MFVLQKRITCKTRVALVQPYLMGSSMDHGFALFWFGFDVCKPLLDWGRSRQSIFAVSSHLLTKWLEVFPWRGQETLRVITFLTRSDKGICRDGFEPTFFSWVYKGLSVHPLQHLTGWGKSSLRLICLQGEPLCGFGTGHIPFLLVSYKAFRIVPSPFSETDLRTLFVNEAVNAQETLPFCQPVILAQAPCMAPGTDCSGQSRAPAGW